MTDEELATEFGALLQQMPTDNALLQIRLHLKRIRSLAWDEGWNARVDHELLTKNPYREPER